MITRVSPLTSHPPILSSLWPAALKDTGNLSPPQRANPLCPNFNWATNPPGLSKQWAPSAADNLACPPPCSLLSRAGFGPASVTVSNSGTTHLHRKCELLTKWLTCLQHVCARCHKCVSTNQSDSQAGSCCNGPHLATAHKEKLTVSDLSKLTILDFGSTNCSAIVQTVKL